ncbi:aminotransferase class I/II-fold pyridoxal phosphate-dependent enzyme [Shinella daejeonensis]|uniref:aminotransferase class I/II-fold pyridoxal phosphate-dependent enzyme n=1 Tax=Shinella daejeonensis TaxID=659017 RepID=UPI0020C7871D|nr:aminotransferase class I/II-fold pyridoxal phosphate-dependent enzyme [Shinella daejeonensis]
MTDRDEISAARMARGRKEALLEKMRGIAPGGLRNGVSLGPAERSVPRFEDLPEYKQVRMQQIASETVGIGNPFYRTHDIAAGAVTRIDDRELINFASYDYLGTNRHPAVHTQVVDALERYGVSASASRLVAGERPVHAELEQRIAAFYGVEAAVVFVSGYLTNVTAISTLLGPEDLVIHDELIHNSALAGIKLSGAARRFFRHNDMAQLEELLAGFSGKFRRTMVIVEGIYSMDGDVADLPRLAELRKRFGFWLMVDEAHALGVLGATGRGTHEHFGIDPTEVDIWMGTLSKTTSSCGGYVAGGEALATVLKAAAGGFVYSVGLPPALAAGASASLDLLAAEPERVTRLRDNGRRFLELAREAGLDTGLSEGHSVVPVIVGDSLRAVRLSNDLLAAGVNVLPIIHPAVPEGQARLRFFITSEHTQEQIGKAVRLTADILKTLERENFGIASVDPGVIARLLSGQ